MLSVVLGLGSVRLALASSSDDGSSLRSSEEVSESAARLARIYRRELGEARYRMMTRRFLDRSRGRLRGEVVHQLTRADFVEGRIYRLGGVTVSETEVGLVGVVAGSVSS
jgi:hypothetical protein